MEEGIEGAHGSRLVHGGVQYRLPQFLSGDGELPHLLHPVIVIFLPTMFFQKAEIFIDLPADIFSHLPGIFRMAERGVEDKQRHVEIPGLNLVPFEDGAADIVAADEHVRSGKTADRSAVYRSTGNIRTGVRTEVTGIAHGFGLLIECSAHAAGADHGPVILRIDGDDIHHNERLHRTATRDPCNLLSGLPGRLGFDIVGRHDFFHLFGGLDLSLFFLRV